MIIKRGLNNINRLIFIGDNTSTSGAGLTGLSYNSTGLKAFYYASDLLSTNEITLVSSALGSWVSGGFVEVDASNMPGWYQFGIPNAALDSGYQVAIQLNGVSNMIPVNIFIELNSVNYQNINLIPTIL